MRNWCDVKIRQIRMLSHIAGGEESAVGLSVKLGISRSTFYTNLNALIVGGWVKMESDKLVITDEGSAFLMDIDGGIRTPEA